MKNYIELEKLLTPYDINHTKVRVGGKNPSIGEWDGNYVLSKDVLPHCECVYTYGVGEDISSEKDLFTNFNLKSFLYDHTVNGYSLNVPNSPFKFKQEGLGFQPNCNDFLEHYDENGTNGEVLLKIDIEGSEYDYFEKVDIEKLQSKTAILLLELHGLDNDVIANKAIKLLSTLNEYFVLHHIHANNYGTIVNNIPSVPELSFVNKKYVETKKKDNRKFPIEGLDFPNTAQYGDITMDFTKNRLKTYRSGGGKIPNIFNFVFGLKEQTDEFSLIYYLSLKSCLEVNNPDKINFYYKHEPYGKYWEMIKPHLTLIQVEPPTQIFGIPIKHYAHQADIIRLQALIEEGGVYADIDTIFVNPIPAELFEKSFVMGKQGNEGLCNALMMSEPNSYFAMKWLSDHSICFKGGMPGSDGWCTHSVYYPLHLSKQIPNNIHIEETSSFFNLLYHQPDIKKLFKESVTLGDNVYSLHLWENVSWEPYLGSLTLNDINTHDTTFNLIAREYIKDLI